MDKQEFKRIMLLIKGAYGDRFQELSAYVMDAWYAGIGDLDVSGIELVVEQYIRNNRFPPTIAELRCLYIKLPVTVEKQDRFAVMPKELRMDFEKRGIIEGQGLNLGNATAEQIGYLKEQGIL